MLGIRTLNEMIGRTDKLDMRRAIHHWKAQGLDFSRLLYRPEAGPGTAVYHRETQDHGLEGALDHTLIEQAPRSILRRQLRRAAEAGYQVMAGSELEYYIFNDSYREAAARA